MAVPTIGRAFRRRKILQMQANPNHIPDRSSKLKPISDAMQKTKYKYNTFKVDLHFQTLKTVLNINQEDFRDLAQ